MKVAGFGYRQGAKVESLLSALDATGGKSGVTHLAVVDAKAGPVISSVADQLKLPVHMVPSDRLPAAQVQSHHELSAAHYGTGSVSEAVALIAAGKGARLVVPRAISDDKMATCAIAEGGEA